MYIIVEFVGDDHFSHIIDTNKFDQLLKADVEGKIKQDPYTNFPPKYFKALQDGSMHGNIFPITIEGFASVCID